METKRYDLVTAYKVAYKEEPSEKFLKILLSFEEIANASYIDGYEDGKKAVTA